MHFKSTVAVALWTLTNTTAAAPKLTLVLDGALQGGVGPIAVNNPEWTARNV